MLYIKLYTILINIKILYIHNYYLIEIFLNFIPTLIYINNKYNKILRNFLSQKEINKESNYI